MYSHSRINTFKQCAKLYQYKYVDLLQPLEFDSKNLSMGKAFHTGIEFADVNKAIEFIDNDSYFMSQDGEIDKAICIAMVDVFIKKFPECKTWKHEEHLIGTIIDKDDFQVIIDGVEEHDNGLYLIELKTTSALNDAYLKKLDFNDQILRYWYIAQQYYKKQILGVKYYIVQKPKLRQKMNESVTQFIERLEERLNEDDSIVSLVLDRTQDQVNECIEDTKHDILTLQNCTRFTKNLAGCSLYGACPYIELCRGTEDAELLFNRKDNEDVTGEQEST